MFEDVSHIRTLVLVPRTPSCCPTAAETVKVLAFPGVVHVPFGCKVPVLGAKFSFVALMHLCR